MAKRDYYEVLGVQKGATADEIMDDRKRKPIHFIVPKGAISVN